MVRRMKETLFLVWLLIFSACCIKETVRYPVDLHNFTYYQKGNHAGQFFINGYYSCMYDNYVLIYYFFEDGTICSFAVEKNKIPLNNSCPEIEGVREIPYYWGAYIVAGDTVKIQTFDSYRGTCEKFEIEEFRGLIENDTIIRFFQKISSDGDEQRCDLRYNYVKCYNKPDSTNVLMKY